MDLAVLGWDNDDDDEEESEMDRIAYDKMEADFLAKMKAERALAAAPQHVPAASDEVALSKASQFLEACFETLAYGDVPDEATLEHMRQTSGLSVATILDVSPPPLPPASLVASARVQSGRGRLSSRATLMYPSSPRRVIWC